MPRLLSSGGNRRRESRPRAQRPRRQWVLRREYVLVRRRRPQSSRRRPQAPRVRLPRRRSPSRDTTDASPTDIPLDAQDHGTQDTPIIIPDDTTTAADEPIPPRAFFITITTLQAPGWWGAYHVHVEWQRAANSTDRLLRSQCEDSAVWDPATQSVSFAVIGDDPDGAITRVFERFIGGIGRVEPVDEDLEDLLQL